MMRLAFLTQLRPDGGAQAIGADQRGTFDAASIGGMDDDAVAAILEAGGESGRLERDLGACPAGIHQHLVQVDPVNDDVGVPETGPERSAERKARDLLARIGVDHQAGIRHIALVENRISNTKPIEHRNHVGAELDAIADGAEFRRLFENTHAPAGAAQGERGGQPAEAATHDDDRLVRASHALTSGSRRSA
jgi:hypothetical protein